MRQETYDILNVGKHNRFFIRGAGGDPICVHNCGYGMSANTFKIRMELTGNHEAAGMSDTLVTAFRHKNYKIPMFWNRCNDVLEIMLAGGSIRFGGPNGDLFYADGSTEFFGVRIPTIQLPNGQYIFYQNLRKEVGDNGRMQFVYDQFKGSQSVPTRVWGSIIDENLSQALSFVVLKWQAIEIAKRGVPISLNVHDEWVSVVPREQAPQVVVIMYKAMKSVPDYIPQGLLDCEVDVGWNYGTLHTVDVGKFIGAGL